MNSSNDATLTSYSLLTAILAKALYISLQNFELRNVIAVDMKAEA